MKALKKTKKVHKPSTKDFINPSSTQACSWWGLCMCHQLFSLLSKTRLCHEEVPHQLEGTGGVSLRLAGPDHLHPLASVSWHHLTLLDGHVPCRLSAG